MTFNLTLCKYKFQLTGGSEQMKEQVLNFCFMDIVTNIVYPITNSEKKPNKDSILEYTYSSIKDIFNAIFKVNDELCNLKFKNNGEPRENRLIINCENVAELLDDKRAMKNLLLHAKGNRIYQVPCLKEIYKFWAKMTTIRTYPIDNVINNINAILVKKSESINFNPADSAFDKFFELLDYSGDDEKAIINEIRKKPSIKNSDGKWHDYSKEAFVYLLVASLYLKKEEFPSDNSKYSNCLSTTFVEYLRARIERINNADSQTVGYSPEVSAAVQNTETSFRLRLTAAAEHQLDTAAKYAERLSSMLRTEAAKLPVIDVSPMDNNNNSVKLHEEIIERRLNRAHLVGIGGAGKSRYLITLGSSLLNNSTIPMYIPLNELHGRNIAEYITELLDAEYTEASNNKTAVRDFLNGELGCTSVLLLDGFNEITDSVERSRIAVELRDFSPDLIVVITSRYEITELYDIDNYKKLTLSSVGINDAVKFIKDAVPKHCNELIGMVSECNDDGKQTLLPFMSTPMALTLLVSAYKQRNCKLIHESPKNIGQLIENYIQCISCCTEDSFFSDETIDRLAYIGLEMSVKGIYEIDLGSCLRGYARDTVHTDKAKSFFSDLFRSFTRQNDSKVSFVHQNFRDGFAALFLHSVLMFGNAEELNRYFELSISNDVRRLLADVVSGSDCIRKHFADNYENLSAQCIGQLISVASQAEEDLSEYDFSELDLTASKLNSVKLYNKKSGNIADLSNSKINISTISANGHTGKIDALLFLLNRFVVSFAKDSFYCFDMERRSGYILVCCENSPVTDAIKYMNDTVIVNHTCGHITVYRYYIENNTLHFEKTDSLEQSSLKSHSITLYGRRIYGVCYGGTIFSFGISDYRISDYVSEEFKCNGENKSLDALNFHTGPRIAVWGERLCACLGNRVVILVVNNGKLTESAEINEISDGDIHDIIAFDGKLYLNVRTAESTSIAVYDAKPECAGRCQEKHSRSFLGIDRFSIGKSGLYAAINIEDTSFQAGVRKISLGADGIAVAALNGTRHTMSVNVCLPFRYKKQDYVATGSTDRSVEILREKNDELSLISAFAGHYEGIHSFCLTNSGEIITAQYSGEVSVWECTGGSWKCTESWKHHDWVWHVRNVRLNKKDCVISCSYDHTIIVYNLTDHEFLIRPIKSDSRITAMGVVPKSNSIRILYGIAAAEDPSTELNAVQTTLAVSKGASVSVSTVKIMLNSAIAKPPLNMPIRCIESDKDNSIICCSDSTSSRVFSCSDTTVCEIKNECFRNIKIRCVSFDGDMTVYGGDDSNSRSGKVLLVKNKSQEIVFDSPVSCVKVFSDKKRHEYFAVGTYGCKIYLYDDDGNALFCIQTSDKILCIDVFETYIMYSLLNGELYRISIDEAIAGTAEPEVIIKTTSGFGGFCGVDFSECTITDKSSLNDELTYYT